MRWSLFQIMARPAAAVALLLLALAPLAACGKRPGELTPPKGEEKLYPRQYPAW